MDNNLFITNAKPEVFEFELEVEGLSANDVRVQFCLKSVPFDMVFPCTRVSEKTWSVEFPAMGFLEPTSYKYHVEVVVDGYYFEAHTGALTVSKSPEVYVRKENAIMKVTNRNEPADEKFQEVIDRLKGASDEPVKESKKVVAKADPILPKANAVLTESVESPAKPKKADAARVRQIIAETAVTQQDRKNRETLRLQRLAEASRQSDPKPKATKDTPSKSENDSIAKTILESAGLDHVKVPKRANPISFRKGNKVVK